MKRPYHHSTTLKAVNDTYLMFLWLDEHFGAGVGLPASIFDANNIDFGTNTWCFALSPILKSDNFQVRLDLWFINIDDSVLFKLMYGD